MHSRKQEEIGSVNKCTLGLGASGVEGPHCIEV
jgi:hypothetical protein